MSSEELSLGESVAIPRLQRDLHIASELAAVFLVVPALAWVALNPRVPTTARTIAGTVALLTLVVDGALLSQWRRN